VANVVIWEKVFERFRRVVLGAGMIGIKGRIQREGEVVHVVARELFDLSAELAGVGARDAEFLVPHGRGGDFYHTTPGLAPHGLPKPRSLVEPYGYIGDIKVKTRDFR